MSTKSSPRMPFFVSRAEIASPTAMRRLGDLAQWTREEAGVDLILVGHSAPSSYAAPGEAEEIIRRMELLVVRSAGAR